MAEISWPWQYSFPPFFTKTWKYINEGNAHIVIGIQEDNPDSNYVLRLVKEDGKSLQLNSIRKSADFVNLVMMPLVSNTFYGQLEVVEIPAQELPQLIRDLKKFRPKERLIKSQISCYAVKTRNLTILDPKAINYCVEIKPKEGFIASNFQKYGKCYYCLRQFLKLEEGQISNASKYCPLDLFSGDRNRMKTALFHLSESPQNNFKLFENGQIVFSEINKSKFNDVIGNIGMFPSTDVFFDFVIDALLASQSRQIYKLKNTKTDSNINKCNATCHLYEQTTLYKILQTQKLCDRTKDVPTMLNIESLDYVSTILEQLDSNSNLYKNIERDQFLDKTDAVHLALIAAIAKDCSIMITFSNQNYTSDDDKEIENLEFILISEKKVPFKVSVTDLEPKLPKTLTKRRDTERKLIELYEKKLIQENGYDPATLRNPF